MKRLTMNDYEETCQDFQWQVPSSFNFGTDVIDYWATKNPDHIALIACNEAGEECRFSFLQISQQSNQLANLLQEQGIVKGDRILVMLPRIPQWQLAIIACLKVGAIPIPCTTLHTRKDIDYRVCHSGAVGAITTQTNIAKFETLPKSALRLCVDVHNEDEGWLDFNHAMFHYKPTFSPVPIAAEDPAIIYYTSGSTGSPKGVVHSSRSLFTWRVSAWYWLTLRESDTIWCTADTGWSKAGTSILFGPWSCGSTVLFYDGPFDPQKRLDLLEYYEVTVYCAAATEIRRLISLNSKANNLEKLRLTVSAGESVNPEIVQLWQQRTGSLLLDGYGQTETLMTVLNYPCVPVKPGSMGRPLPGTEVAVLDLDNNRVAPEECGRLAIKMPNPQLMLGYWNDAERSKASQVTIEGTDWFITGDTVIIDQDGYLFYNGRDDDIINSSGYRIGPTEVENAVMEHPAVQEAAVVGSPDLDRGELVTAFVILREEFKGSDSLVREIQNFSKQVTAPYKYPRKIYFVTEFPRTVTGKILRRELRRRTTSALDT
ncbi:MAG: AMP-binding protein [Halieaceae bacterium]|jgi:acyl-coenzyme A synthetase/AMP-(fatty) acid ligase|nr:AMP-binding protein [Halieaceae bacterium]